MKVSIIQSGDYAAGIKDHHLTIDLGDFDEFYDFGHRQEVALAIGQLYLAMYGDLPNHVFFEDQCLSCNHVIAGWNINKPKYCVVCGDKE